MRCRWVFSSSIGRWQSGWYQIFFHCCAFLQCRRQYSTKQHLLHRWRMDRVQSTPRVYAKAAKRFLAPQLQITVVVYGQCPAFLPPTISETEWVSSLTILIQSHSGGNNEALGTVSFLLILIGFWCVSEKVISFFFSHIFSNHSKIIGIDLLLLLQEKTLLRSPNGFFFFFFSVESKHFCLQRFWLCS